MGCAKCIQIFLPCRVAAGEFGHVLGLGEGDVTKVIHGSLDPFGCRRIGVFEVPIYVMIKIDGTILHVDGQGLIFVAGGDGGDVLIAKGVEGGETVLDGLACRGELALNEVGWYGNRGGAYDGEGKEQW